MVVGRENRDQVLRGVCAIAILVLTPANSASLCTSYLLLLLVNKECVIRSSFSVSLKMAFIRIKDFALRLFSFPSSSG